MSNIWSMVTSSSGLGYCSGAEEKKPSKLRFILQQWWWWCARAPRKRGATAQRPLTPPRPPRSASSRPLASAGCRGAYPGQCAPWRASAIFSAADPLLARRLQVRTPGPASRVAFVYEAPPGPVTPGPPGPCHVPARRRLAMVAATAMERRRRLRLAVRARALHHRLVVVRDRAGHSRAGARCVWWWCWSGPVAWPFITPPLAHAQIGSKTHRFVPSSALQLDSKSQRFVCFSGRLRAQRPPPRACACVCVCARRSLGRDVALARLGRAAVCFVPFIISSPRPRGSPQSGRARSLRDPCRHAALLRRLLNLLCERRHVLQPRQLDHGHVVHLLLCDRPARRDPHLARRLVVLHDDDLVVHAPDGGGGVARRGAEVRLQQADEGREERRGRVRAARRRARAAAPWPSLVSVCDSALPFIAKSRTKRVKTQRFVRFPGRLHEARALRRLGRLDQRHDPQQLRLHLRARLRAHSPLWPSRGPVGDGAL